MKNLKCLIILLPTILSSCIDDEDWYRLNRFTPPPIQQEGLFIVNEGNFTYDNASLSYYDIDAQEVYNQVFLGTNEIPLGDVAHSMTIRDSLGYIVVNNSGKIYVIHTRSFEYMGKITGLTSPRYIHFVSDRKAYVSDLYARSIAIVDPHLLEITGSIDVRNPDSGFGQHPTEQMVQYQNYVFTNCWSHDNKILVIDTETDELVDSIRVIHQPVSMVLDRYDKLWVLSDGGFPGSPSGEETPGLTMIDAQTRQVEKTYPFDPDDLPSALSINSRRDTLYYINRHVYRHPVRSNAEPELFIESPYTQLISGFRALEVDPYNSEIYLADAVDHVQRGWIYRFSPSGIAIDTFQVGLIPGDLCFKPLN
jgi:hypothetical protein